MAPAGANLRCAEGVGNWGTIGKGQGDDEAVRRLMELDLSWFGAEEGDS